MNNPSNISTIPVRVRYAPSPTGYLHVGGLRTLLFNYLYAKKKNGKFLIRIENTDQERSTPEFERLLLADIDTMGLSEDEGPVKGGDFGPYRQSDRMEIYGQAVRDLMDKGSAYYCFCTAEAVSEKREAAMKAGLPAVYDGTCARLPHVESEKRIQAGEKAGVRFKAPNKNFILKDEVRGTVEFKAGTVGDFLLTRSPNEGEKQLGFGLGMPTYNFACVIDDYGMQISHVIRGEDHLSNTARQLMIYDAFGWTLPVFAHTSMVLGADKQKLSKRNGDTSTNDYLNNGYLKETLINFLAFLGWSPKESANLKPVSGHPEILTFDELVNTFDLDGLQKAPAVFNVEKLQWMNAQYIRALPLATIVERARPFFEKTEIETVRSAFKTLNPAAFSEIINLIREKVTLLLELPEASRIFFEDEPKLDEAAVALLKEPTAKSVLDAFSAGLAAEPENITVENFDLLQKKVLNDTGVKGKSLFMPIRVVVTGRLLGPEVKMVAPLLGRDRILKRLEYIRKTVRI